VSYVGELTTCDPTAAEHRHCKYLNEGMANPGFAVVEQHGHRQNAPTKAIAAAAWSHSR
jgi:hypothetical protein